MPTKTESPESARLGEINLKLQLAREELAAARLEAGELAEQSGELEAMTENMDELVTMRQNQLAQLQQQLEEARTRQAAITTGDSDSATDLTAMDATGTIASEDASSAANSESNVDAAVQVAGADASAPGTDAAVTAGDNASTEQLAMTDAGTAAVAEQAVANQSQASQLQANEPQANEPWYSRYISDPKTLGVGVGGLALVGLLYALLRRRRNDGEEDLDDVVFLDGEADATQSAVAAQGDDTVAAMETAADDMLDDTVVDVAAGSETATAADATLDEETERAVGGDEPDSDDTISEAEVYLAYGLHGQAEDLLSKAVEKSPDNADYQLKLLQTYHAQGKHAEFDEVAARFHDSFGGEASPHWSSVMEMGNQLNPTNQLYLDKADAVESVGRGDAEAPKLDSMDFEADSVEQVDGISSEIREFSSLEESSNAEGLEDVEGLGGLENDEHDQTLDPAAAFDISDLEASGQFTALSEDLQSTPADDGVIEFPDFEANTPGAVDAAEQDSANDNQIDLEQSIESLGDSDSVDFAADALSADDTSIESMLPETDDLADIENLSASVEDLTSDLDQLEGELELDGTEMLDSGLDMTQDLEMPDLTTDSDLTADASAAFGNVDEMETMMDLAKAYIDMGDNDSASSALGEIVKSGSPEQKSEAESLLRKIS